MTLKNLHETGCYILIEGEEGVGKSSVAAAVTGALHKAGYAALQTREPTDGPIGKVIREAYYAKHRPADGISRDIIRPEAFPYVFLADRIDHMAGVVTPCLSMGGIVVQDRGFLSSLVHQGGSGDWTWLLALHTQVRKPDKIFILDAPLATLIERRAQRGDRASQYSEDASLIIEARRQRYLSAQERLRGIPITILDARRDTAVLAREILTHIGIPE